MLMAKDDFGIIEMPQTYSDHHLCIQIRYLREEEALQDVQVFFGSSGTSIRANSFLLSLLSPSWRNKLCTGSCEQKSLNLNSDEELVFRKIFDLGCGIPVPIQDGLHELLVLGSMASRNNIVAVLGALEDELLRMLTMETCAEILTGAISGGMMRVESQSRRLALDDFEAFSQTEGFLELKEDVLNSLLSDDQLKEAREEVVLEATVRWMRGSPGNSSIRGERLLQNIRFPLMDRQYLLNSARDLLPDCDRLQVLVLESLALLQVPNNQRHRVRIKYLDNRSCRPRALKNIPWSEYAEIGGGEERILIPVHAFAVAVSAGDTGLVCCGLMNGQVGVWSKSTLEHEACLTGHVQAVRSTVVWDGYAIGGSDDGEIRAWDLATGEPECVLRGHQGAITALAVSGDRLLSASRDKFIRIWRMLGPALTWRCVHTLAGHEADVLCLETFGGRAMSGSADRTIRVWVVGTGASEWIFRGHEGPIEALVAVRGQRLLSSSRDKTVRLWSLLSGTCEGILTVYLPQSPQYVRCMAIVGSKLITGSASWPYSSQETHEVRVWDIWTLSAEACFPQPTGCAVNALCAEEDRLWACVGPELVTWGCGLIGDDVAADTGGGNIQDDASIVASF